MQTLPDVLSNAIHVRETYLENAAMANQLCRQKGIKRKATEQLGKYMHMHVVITSRETI